MAQNNFTDILNRVFSQKIILKRLPGDRLKTIDFDKLQSINFQTHGNFRGVHLNRGAQNNFYFGSGKEMIDNIRIAQYQDYELMDSDSIISAALDVYADEATVRNEYGNILSVRCDDVKRKALLNNLYFDILNIEFNLWYWIRGMVKYGDFFVITPCMKSVGIVDAIPMHPIAVRRNDFAGENNDETRFIYEGQDPYVVSKFREDFKYNEVAHFRLISDSNFLPYGKSMLEGARTTWKKIVLTEDAMLIHRIMRAPERRVFKIDTGNIPPEAVDGYIEEIANSMKKVPYMDEHGNYNLRYNLQNMLEDFFLPTRGGESSTEIDTLSGLENSGQLEDLQYLQQKLLSFLRIPKSYLGFDEDVEGKSVLAAEDIKFANLISRIQRIVESELEKLGFIHLLHQGYTPEEASDFQIDLARPSIIYERQKIELMSEKISLASDMIDLKMFSRKHIYENIFNLTSEEWNVMRNEVIRDLQEKFREEQIESEGNDPAVSGRSFGTPHDIVSMQLASAMGSNEEIELSTDVRSLYKKDKRHENPGRPKSGKTIETDRDVNGRDPLGHKALKGNFGSKKALESFLKNTQKEISILKEDKNTEQEITSLFESKILDLPEDLQFNEKE